MAKVASRILPGISHFLRLAGQEMSAPELWWSKKRSTLLRQPSENANLQMCRNLDKDLAEASRQSEPRGLTLAAMKPATLFDLIVKSFGVYLLVQAIGALSGYFTVIGVDFQGQHISRIGILRVIILAAAAVWFLYGAHPIQDWAYPKSDSQENDQSAASNSNSPFCVSCGKPISADTKNCPACGWTQPE